MLNANFTMCFKDVTILAPDIMDNLTMSTESRTNSLHSMLHAVYDNKEISGETIPEFQLFLEMKFKQYKDYYEELLDIYESQINWQGGEILTIEDDTTNTRTRVYTPRAEYRTEETFEPSVTTTTTNYDLPRSASTENHPTTKSTTSPSGSNVSTTYTGGTSGTDTTADSDTGSLSRESSRVNLVEQKRKMLDLLRNVYKEFADKFRACFLDLYF